MIVAKLCLEMHRLNGASLFPGEPFASRAVDGLLLCSIFVGQVEGRPMNASKLAEYGGVSRPTAIRRLRELIGGGLVARNANSTYSLAPGGFHAPGIDAAMQASFRAILAAATELSRLDT